jgi:hypothetical protein
MKQAIALTALLFLAAAGPRQVLIGHWAGTSLCTPVRPACHNEAASYWIKENKSEDMVTIDAGKIVDGKDELMGSSDFRIDWKAHRLTGSLGQATMTLVWSGSTMTGTMNQPDGQVVRNIRLTKQK